MPRVKPPLAIAVAVVLHIVFSALMFALPVTPSAELALAALAVAALVLPGAVAGLLTRARPLVVGLCASVALLLVQAIVTYALLGGMSWTLLLFDMPGQALQLLVLCVAAVASYHLRARLSPAPEAIAG
jgi:hypothetical protein